jgi:peroxin-16
MTSYTELLFEMTAKRLSTNRNRWRVVVLIESFKALLKLLLLRLTNSRPLVSPPLPEREVDPRIEMEKREAEQQHWDGMSTPHAASDSGSDISWTMPRTGLSLPSLPDSSEITEYLLRAVLTADDVKPPSTLLHRMTTLQSQLAEVTWILRPVVYALILQRLSNSKDKNAKKSWTPWLVGVALDVASRQLANRALEQRLPGGKRGLSSLEREEGVRRGWSMGWWVMRGAFWENVTKGVVEGVQHKLEGKPLLDMVGGIIGDYGYLWDNYYFATASS